jgi:hypothetical protein
MLPSSREMRDEHKLLWHSRKWFNEEAQMKCYENWKDNCFLPRKIKGGRTACKRWKIFKMIMKYLKIPHTSIYFLRSLSNVISVVKSVLFLQGLNCSDLLLPQLKYIFLFINLPPFNSGLKDRKHFLYS